MESKESWQIGHQINVMELLFLNWTPVTSQRIRVTYVIHVNDLDMNIRLLRLQMAGWFAILIVRVVLGLQNDHLVIEAEK